MHLCSYHDSLDVLPGSLVVNRCQLGHLLQPPHIHSQSLIYLLLAVSALSL